MPRTVPMSCWGKNFHGRLREGPVRKDWRPHACACRREAEQAVPLVKDALQRGKIVGAICNAASFMAKHGFLNNVKHTGNTIQQLKLWGGQEYTNEAGYEEKQAVSDQNIVTANGTGQLEFCRELLLLLKADTPEKIHASYDFYKNGFVR